jgi:pullulanase
LPLAEPRPGDAANLRQHRAHFVRRELIAWPFDTRTDVRYLLHHAPEGGLTVSSGGLAVAGDRPSGGTFELSVRRGGLPSTVTDTDGYRHLAGRAALEVPGNLDLASWLTGQLAVSATDVEGRLRAATGLQLPGVLDELFATDAPLGVVWAGDVPSVHLWAPTAKRVTLLRFASSTTQAVTRHELTRAGGVWSVTGEPDWDRSFYLYEVEVYVPSTGRVETNVVTDPYSVSLAMDSRRSQIVRLADPDLRPEGWDTLTKPPLRGQRDMVVYELHLRDFSAHDLTVPERHRGRYTAFALEGTDGRRHLRALAEAGLTHLHLLPTFDIATVPEDPDEQVQPVIEMPDDPASELPQAIQQSTRDRQPYNWGYDPFHYTTPEGSYASDPDGTPRIREYREMVAAINRLGLRFVKDVVYNHTHQAGQDVRSVLDRVVPGYYHRLGDTGEVETSTCCPNTATEHAMMERLTIDSVLAWAREYRVDGFRFDLMGHHPRAQLLRLREALDRLTVEEHGVDGARIVLYGEGWNFGEVADDARFVQATQANLAGSGIGTFNDRLRDAVRGGDPFGANREQGFATGLAVDPNGTPQGTAVQQAARARRLADLVRLGLAGNLATYELEAADGSVRRGDQLRYGRSPAGYAATPTDSVAYVSAHDDETLFDAIQYKVPLGLGLDDRVRVQNLALSVVALAQGTPFFHAGCDLLRSKSLDRDSYRSGDWFNRLDWSRRSNNWGVGLPPAEKNAEHWPTMRRLLRRLPAPTKTHLDRNADHLLELLRIRTSSELFRLPDAAAIREQLAFHVTGPHAPLGVVVLSLTGGRDAFTDVLVVLNAGVVAVTIDDPPIARGDWALHPEQAASTDPVVRTSSAADGAFRVPARTTAVFVLTGG